MLLDHGFIYSIAGCVTGQSHNSESCHSQGVITGVVRRREFHKAKSITQELNSFISTLTQQRLNPIKLYVAYKPYCQKAGPFNRHCLKQLGQYASSPHKRSVATQNFVLSPLAVAMAIASTHYAYPRRVAWLSWPGWLDYVCLLYTSPSPRDS